MITLIIGGSGSGKSAFAENCIGLLAEGKKKYYLATMQVFDKEGEKKIERHRRLRSGKGFLTIEQPTAIEKALTKISEKDSCALLECMSNLVANEMFSGEIPGTEAEVTERIAAGISRLKEGLEHLVIVSNNVFEDGRQYDESTMEYIRAMGKINELLADMADRVVEVVVGIPITVKDNSSGTGRKE